MKRYAAVIAAALAATCVGSARAADAVPGYVSASVNHRARPPFDRERDADRKPTEVLVFSGIKPGDRIAELAPERGYYTRMLSKIVGPKGMIYLVVPSLYTPDQERREEYEQLKKGVIKVKAVDHATELMNMHQEYPNLEVLWQQLHGAGSPYNLPDFAKTGQFAVPEQLDAIFVANNYRNLHVPEFAYRKGQMINVKGIAAAMLRTTKNGGTLTIIDDAAKPGTGFTQVATLGRVDEDAVKAEVLSAGWVLDGESKALARTSDPRTAASRDMFYKDDQFILRFKKPATANTNNDRQIVDALRNHFGNTSHSGFDSKSQRWVFYQEDGTFQEYGNTGSWEQQGRVYWDTDGRRCMLKDFPRWERGAVMCHYMLDQLTKKVGDVWTRGTPQKYRLEKGYVFPAAPTREQIESPMW